MVKLTSRYLELGTQKDQVNGRLIPANFSPESYDPTPVDSESIAMISAHLRGIDLKFATMISLTFSDQLIVADGIAEDWTLTNPFDGSSPEMLISDADEAMYRAKHGGGNCYHFSDFK